MFRVGLPSHVYVSVSGPNPYTSKTDNNVQIQKLKRPPTVTMPVSTLDRDSLTSRALPEMVLSTGDNSSMTGPPAPMPHYLTSDGRAIKRFEIEGNAISMSSFSMVLDCLVNSLPLQSPINIKETNISHPASDGGCRYSCARQCACPPRAWPLGSHAIRSRPLARVGRDHSTAGRLSIVQNTHQESQRDRCGPGEERG